MKKAIITGVTGQDGAYLSKVLLNKGYKVYGAFKRNSTFDMTRFRELKIENKVELIPFDLLEFTNIYRTIKDIEPDELYNLAAQSFVGVSFEQPLLTNDINGMGTLRVLEALRTVSPKTRFYQASTSEMFGKVRETPQKEDTPFYPRSPYACSKLLSHWATINYRESYNMFACSGILFNHESPLRGMEFVTRKISYAVAGIKKGLQDKLILGNLDSKRDWGYAAEFVEAIWLMLQQPEPDDFVIATGEAHSVREFIEHAFNYVDIEIEWTGKGIEEKGIDKKTGKVYVELSPDFFRPAEVDILIGDYSKAKRILGWSPKTKFKELVGLMVDADMRRTE